MATTLQKRFYKPSFRNIAFTCTETSETCGRRTANHEYPQYDIAYSEDMGAAQIVFNIKGYVYGPDWEKQRDELRKALQTQGVGTLIHPDYGKLTVQAGSYTSTESKRDAAGKATFDMTFYGTSETRLSVAKKNTANLLQNNTKSSLGIIAKVFDTLYKITQLPQYAADYVSGLMGQMIGISNPYALLSMANTIKDLANGDISLPWQVPVLVSAWTSSVNNDYSDKGTQLIRSGTEYTAVLPNIDNQTNTITPKGALDYYTNIVNTSLDHITVTANSQKAQLEAGKRVELLVKTFAASESAVASSMIDFESIRDAQEIWKTVLNNFDTCIDLATSLDDVASYNEIRTLRALFQDDIQTRAPNLKHIIYRDYNDIVPSILVAYDVYEDITRADEITARNHVRNPNFVLGHLDLLDA